MTVSSSESSNTSTDVKSDSSSGVTKPDDSQTVDSTEKSTEPKSKERRNFLKVIAVAGGILGLTPFIPYGSFFTATLGGTEPTRQRIMTIEGSFANVNDMEPDSSLVFPRSRRK